MVSVGEITVELNLDSTKLTSGLKSAMSQLDSFGRKVEGIESKFGGLANSSALSKLGSTFASIGTTAAVAGIAAIGGAITGTTLVANKSLNTFEDFERAVSNTASTMGKVGGEFTAAKGAISDIAKQLGQDTVFSSQEAATAMYDLASAGYDVAAMGYDGLLPFLNLASATQADLSQTTAMMASTLSIFGMELSETGRVADVFAKAIADSQATMDKLQYSMSYVGPTAAMLNMDLEDTTALLEVLYNGGLQGEKAGTGLRGVLFSLMNPSEGAAAALGELGLTMEDINPLTHDTADIMQLLADRQMNADQAARIFGRTAAAAIGILVAGAGDIKTFEQNLRDAGGAAETMAEQQLDTLYGSLEQLSGNIENMFINIGEALSPTFRDILQGIESLMPGIDSFAVGAAKSLAHFVDNLRSSGQSVVAMGSIIAESMSYVFRQVGGLDLGDNLADMINNMMKKVVDLVIAAKPLIENAIIGIINFIKSTFAGLGPTVDNLKTIASNIIRVIVTLFSGLGSAISGGGASSAITNTINGITDIFADLSTKIADKLIEVIPKLKAGLGLILSTVISWGNNFGNIRSSLEVKMRGIWEVVEEVAERLTPAWTALTTAFSVGLTALEWNIGGTQSIGATLKSVWDNLPQILMDAVDKLQPVWDMLNAAFEFASGLFQGFVTNISPSIDNIKSIFESVVSILGSIGKDIANALSGLFEGLGGGAGAEGLGASIAGVINAITGAIAGLMGWLENNPRVVEFGLALVGIAAAAVSAVMAIAGLVAALAPLVSTIGTVIVIISSMGLSWESVGYVIGYLAQKLFPNLTSALIYIYKNVAPVARIVGSGLASAFSRIAPMLSRLGSSILPLLSRAFGIVGRVIMFVARSGIMTIIRLIPLLFSPLGAVIAVLALLAAAWINNWGGIQEKTAAVVAWLGTQWDKLKEGIAGIGPAFTEAKEKLLGVWDGIKAGISDKIKGVKDTLSGWKDDIGTALDGAGEKVRNFLSDMSSTWDGIKKSFSDAKTSVMETLSGWKEGIAEKISGAQEALDGLKTAADEKWESIKQAFSTAITAVSDTVGTLKESLVTKIDEIKAGLAEKVQAISDTFTAWKDSLSGIFSTVGEAVENLKAGLLEKWDSIKAGIVQKAVEIQNQLLAWAAYLIGIYNQAMSALDNLRTQLLARWDAIKAGIVQKAVEIQNQVLAWHAYLVNIYNQAMAALENLKAQITAKWEALKAAILQKAEEIRAGLVAWLANVKATFMLIVAAVVDLKNKVVQKFTEMKTAVTQKLAEILTAIKTKATEIKNLGTAFYNAAAELGNKLVEGLKSKLSAVKTAASDLVNAAKSAVSGTGSTIKNTVASASKGVVSLATAAARTADDFFPHSPAKKGPLRRLPDWTSVIPGNMDEGIQKMQGYVNSASDMVGRFQAPLADLGNAKASIQLDSLKNINNVTFDKFEYSIMSLIDRMIELINTSDDLNSSLRSSDGYSLQSTASVSSGRNTGSLSSGSLTNVKISTIYNNGSSLSTARLKKAGI